MILTLTLNPSLDRTIEVDSLTRGTVIRAATAHLDPGGKGVNVSRALLANGITSCAVIPYGGDEGRRLVDLLFDEGLDMITVPVTGATRSNVTIAEPDGTVTKINEPGTALSPGELDAVADAVLKAAHSADWVVASGSLPPGVPTDVYARLCARFAAAGILVAVDTSGPALRQAIAASPALVKPNREELAEATGAPISSLGDAVGAALTLREQGARAVLASLGADGAILLTGGDGTDGGTDGGTGDGTVRAWYGHAPVPEPRSTVGAGDAMLAGLLAAGGPAGGGAALAEAVAWATAAVGLPGSRMPVASDIRRDTVTVQEIDVRRAGVRRPGHGEPGRDREAGHAEPGSDREAAPADSRDDREPGASREPRELDLTKPLRSGG
ncbi:1-phosphofructokinase [Acrocarpospora phusangensis]|uniref:1-phosphofructokinase n=1 Tax=Acrocarpospora phusangensis TaxID=1070424 RepID=A0A919QG05_9ACTN|nr:1-phosphofructokinase family hexose kinase [Acrocarpospora phusangensis]GIH28103.1 1-phosphofructokinase [Acrocarpospora phusangensis]